MIPMTAAERTRLRQAGFTKNEYGGRCCETGEMVPPGEGWVRMESPGGWKLCTVRGALRRLNRLAGPARPVSRSLLPLLHRQPGYAATAIAASTLLGGTGR